MAIFTVGVEKEQCKITSPSLSSMRILAVSRVIVTPAENVKFSILRDTLNTSVSSTKKSSSILMLIHATSCPLMMVNTVGSGGGI